MAKIRVRARAVDMLGRQQIAGIPTAIHELFKNAHDAYAKRVEVDYFRSDRLLILRDDGHGMTRAEFEDRWLTLGTESKVGANFRESPWPELFNLPRRPVMGEKGIGRLAMAAIGPQVLVVTRAIDRHGLSPPVVCFVHWGLFEVPGLDLDRIEIPIAQLDQGQYPDRDIVHSLVEQIRKNLDVLGNAIPEKHRDSIALDLRQVDFDPAAFLDYLHKVEDDKSGPDLRGMGHGTHFFVLKTDRSLNDDIDKEEGGVATPLKKNLLGFSNTMIVSGGQPQIMTRFRDHLRDGRIDELIARDNFLLPEEFESADHHFEGRFDSYGQFEGRVQIYGEEPIQYTLPWRDAGGLETECGPFAIRVAYVQGNSDETRLAPEDWARLTAKLNKIGGLYIYRDGIRILPYGNLDFDFLHIESRRSKSAKDWFFSYRRMFGAVEITSKDNPALQEKAGREGFRTNTAYRQFRAILEQFVQRLAFDFFRPTAEHGDEFRRIRGELKERERLLKKKAEMAREKKKAFVSDLEIFFKKIEEGVPAQRAEQLRNEYSKRLDAIEKLKDPDVAGAELVHLERGFAREVHKLQQDFSVTRPRGVGLSKQLSADWQAYQKNAARLDDTVCGPLRAVVENRIGDLVASGVVVIDRRKRLEAVLNDQSSRHSLDAKRLAQAASNSLTDLNTGVKTSIADSLRRLTDGIGLLTSELQRTRVAEMSDSAFENYRTGMLARVEALAHAEIVTLERLHSELDVVSQAVHEGESVMEMADAAEDQTLAMREELSGYTEYAQTGMALGIIQHEFASTVQSVREAIRKLKPWADGTPELAGIHQDLRASFEHLDGYLTLFTPLSRRLYRIPIELTGEEIRRYLTEIFGDRLGRHNIELTASNKFDAFSLKCYPSTFLPVFINLVDNAIYWITLDRDSERWIRLDADERSFSVSNGGQGIEIKDADRIFEFGESNKPGGRGMGLYISRQALQRENWDITLESPGRDTRPSFRIAPIENRNQEEKE